MNSPQDNDEIKEQLEEASIKALKFLSFRPRSEKEISDFLLKKKYKPEIIEKVIERLKEQKLAGDEDFAKWWIEQRQEFNIKSKFVIKNELLQKGVNKQVIEKILDESTDDYQTALLTFEKNKHKFKNYTGREYFQKASAFLQRKGFNWETVKKVLKAEDSLY